MSGAEAFAILGLAGCVVALAADFGDQPEDSTYFGPPSGELATSVKSST